MSDFLNESQLKSLPILKDPIQIHSLRESVQTDKFNPIPANDVNESRQIEDIRASLLKNEVQHVEQLSSIREGVKTGHKSLFKTKQEILKEEKTTKNYDKYGIGFELGHANVNEADSPRMVALKEALNEYLRVKADILSNKDNIPDDGEETEEQKGRDLIYSEEDIQTDKYSDRRDIYRSEGKTASGLSMKDEDRLREAYDRLDKAIHHYTLTKLTMFKFGRGKKRLRQVQLIADQLQEDNRRFNLSQKRHDLWNPKSVEGSLASSYVIPNYRNAFRLQDVIDRRDEELNRKDQNHMYHWRWWWTALKNIPNRIGQVYNILGGTALRMTAIPTMVAANSLELGAKLLKFPLKGLSMITNGAFKLFGSKKRWRVNIDKRTLSHGWTGFEQARRLNQLALYSATMGPLGWTMDGITELLKGAYTGARYLAGKETESGDHFKITSPLNASIKAFFKKRGRIIKDFFGKGSYYGVEGGNSWKEIADRADQEKNDILTVIDAGKEADHLDES